MDEFQVYLLSAASMKFFADNTLVFFKGQFPQNISLECDCRVPISENIFPSYINKVYRDFLYHVHNIKGRKNYTRKTIMTNKTMSRTWIKLVLKKKRTAKIREGAGESED